MKSFFSFLMQILPFAWMLLGFYNMVTGQYDRAAYDMAAGAFFMIMPMYYAFLEGRRD